MIQPARLVLLHAVLASVLSAGAASLALAASKPTLVRCRVGDQRWHSCALTLHRRGEHWEFSWGSKRIELRHDGSGLMHIRHSIESAWQPVQPTWVDKTILCWGSLCAQGDVPLD